jgi:hypothetical protein
VNGVNFISDYVMKRGELVRIFGLTEEVFEELLKN